MNSKYWSQRDPMYAEKYLGTGKQKFKDVACLLVSLSNLTKVPPLELNDMFTTTGVYSNGNMIDCAKAASRLWYTYKKQSNNPKIRCIAETDAYKSKGVPQHFFMLKPDKSIIDPLDNPPNFKKNPYHIVSYRIFEKLPKLDEPKNEATIEPKPEIVPDVPVGEENAPEATGTPQNESPQVGSYTATPVLPENYTTEKNWLQKLIEKLIEIIIKFLEK